MKASWVLGAFLVAGALALTGFVSSAAYYQDELFGFAFPLPAGAAVRWGTSPLRIDLAVPPHTTLVEDYLLLEIRVGEAERGTPVLIAAGREGAAGSRYEYRRYEVGLLGGYSLVLTFVLHSVNPAVYDRPPPAFDRPRAIGEWEAILAGLEVFPPGLEGQLGPR